jgi:hypothetical protein
MVRGAMSEFARPIPLCWPAARASSNLVGDAPEYRDRITASQPAMTRQNGITVRVNGRARKSGRERSLS